MAGIVKTSINLDKIPKDKIIEGKKGRYLNLVFTVNNEQDQFGNQGPVCVDQTKEERDAKTEKVYLGNVKVVWTDGNFPAPIPYEKQPTPQKQEMQADDLPF
tara:strand:+ start:1034 stop:1339 length:306 start_codon:yes stop_codon:yes gene_type:complete